MNRKLLLLLVLVVLGAVAWWLQRNDAPTTLDRPLSDFAVPDTAGVSRIHISDTKGQVVDLKRTPQGWTLNDRYAAKQAEVDLLLRTFNRVEVKSPVPKSMQPHTLRLMAAGAKKVEIYEGGDTPSKIWLVGHGTKDHFGTFMLLEKPGLGRSNAPFIVGMGGFTGVLNTRFHTKEDLLRSTDFFSLADMRDLASVRLETPAAPGNGYTMEQDADGRYALKDQRNAPYPFDTILVSGAVLPLKRINFESIERLPKASRDSLINSTPNHILTITKRNGEQTRAKFWFRPYKGVEPPFGQPRPLYDPIYMDALLGDSLHVQMQRPAFERIFQPISGFRP